MCCCVLPGEDFDQRVMEYFIKLIKKKYKVDVSKDARALQKLRREAERAKRALSSQHQVCVWTEWGRGPLGSPVQPPAPNSSEKQPVGQLWWLNAVFV